MGNNTHPRIIFNCDYCGISSSDKPSHYKRKKRHFCSRSCYSKYVSEVLPKEEQPRFGSGFDEAEREKRKKARSILNHYLRDKKIVRPGCEVCGGKSEAHHDNYSMPLEVKWLCFKHHRLYHQNPELISK